MNKSDTRFTVWGSTELLLLEFECALEISQELPYLTKLPQNYLPALLDPNPEAPPLLRPLEGICSTQKSSCLQTPHLTSATAAQRRLCEEINSPLCWITNIYQISCSSYRSLNWLYFSFLSIFLTYLSGWVYSLVKPCQLGHAPALPQPPDSAVWQGISGFLFFWSSPEAPSCSVGCSEHIPATPWAELGTPPHWENIKSISILFWVTLKVSCPAAGIGSQPAHSLCGLPEDLWCPLTNNFLAVKFLRFVNNVADKCTAITQHLHWVSKQGCLLWEERRRMCAQPCSEEWGTFCVSRQRNTPSEGRKETLQWNTFGWMD